MCDTRIFLPPYNTQGGGGEEEQRGLYHSPYSAPCVILGYSNHPNTGGGGEEELRAISFSILSTMCDTRIFLPP